VVKTERPASQTKRSYVTDIETYKPSEIDIQELAAFIYQVRRAELDGRGISRAELENRLVNVWQFVAYVLARSEGALIGYALLYRIGDSDLIEINPGTTLGHQPVVAPGFDEKAVGAAMVEAAKECVVQEGFDALYIDIPWDPAASPASYDVYHDRYGALGFQVIQQVRQMNISLPAEVPAVNLPPGTELAQIQTVDQEALYQCHHQAYMAGQAQYYFQMDEAERRDDFQRIYAPNIREHPASLVLTRHGTVLGYCLLFAEGEFSELMSLAVHPDHQRRGYGRLLMHACLKRAGEEGLEAMHLIVDVKNESATALYRQCGFKDAGGNMTFKWKA
jgi:[ribosomal protein S18]-alanine N-acetyltransferase